MPHLFNCKKVGRVQLSSNFLLLFITNRYCYHTHVRDLNTLFKKHTSKVGILQRRKTNFERRLIFLSIKISARSNKIELIEEFMAIWREEQTLWDVMFPLYPDKNEKDKSLKRMSDKFQIFSD